MQTFYLPLLQHCHILYSDSAALYRRTDIQHTQHCLIIFDHNINSKELVYLDLTLTADILLPF